MTLHQRRFESIDPRTERRTDRHQIFEYLRRLVLDAVEAAVSAALLKFQAPSPWMTAESAALYLDFRHCQDPVNAFRSWAKREAQKTPPLVCVYRGDVPLWHRDDLDAAINAANRTAARRTA